MKFRKYLHNSNNKLVIIDFLIDGRSMSATTRFERYIFFTVRYKVYKIFYWSGVLLKSMRRKIYVQVGKKQIPKRFYLILPFCPLAFRQFVVIITTQIYYNHGQNICETGQYGESLISIFQGRFASIEKISILGGRLSTRL